MATAVYQNQLEYEMRALGYGIERGKNHAPDIKGYSPEYLEAESLRSGQIGRELEERGAVGREQRVQVAHQNRDEKQPGTKSALCHRKRSRRRRRRR